MSCLFANSQTKYQLAMRSNIHSIYQHHALTFITNKEPRLSIMKGSTNELSKPITLRKLKPDEIHDASAPALKSLPNQITDADIAEYQKTVQHANIERWETALVGLTFATRYVPISIDQAKAFKEAADVIQRKQSLDPSIVKKLKEVDDALQAAIERHPSWATRGVIVKTSSRSAKDAVAAQRRLVDMYKDYVRQHAKPPYPVNDRIIGLLHAAMQALKCMNSKEAMDMLTQSERIHQDMCLALEVYESNGTWEEHLVVREWVDINVSQEWRCFVKSRKVTAISQYNYLAHFPQLIAKRVNLETVLLSFLNDKVIPALQPEDEFQDMIIDVALTGDVYSTDAQCWVVELNPVLSWTDGALFSWSKDLHLLNGKAPFELRLNEKSSDRLRACMLHEFRHLLDTIVIDEK